MGKLNFATATINTLLNVVQSAFDTSTQVLKADNGGTGVTNLNALRASLGLGNSTTAPLAPEQGGTGVTSISELKGLLLAGGSGEAIGVAAGGTGRQSLDTNALLAGNGTGQVKMIGTSGTGVLQVNAANQEPSFGTVPVAFGGTGVTTLNALTNLLGLGNASVSGANPTFDAIPVTRGGTGVTSLPALSNALGLGDNLSAAIPLDRGGTGATSISGVKTNLGYVANNGGDNLKGDYLIDGNLYVKNTSSNPSVQQYNLTDRLAQIEQDIATLKQKTQNL